MLRSLIFLLFLSFQCHGQEFYATFRWGQKVRFGYFHDPHSFPGWEGGLNLQFKWDRHSANLGISFGEFKLYQEVTTSKRTMIRSVFFPVGYSFDIINQRSWKLNIGPGNKFAFNRPVEKGGVGNSSFQGDWSFNPYLASSCVYHWNWLATELRIEYSVISGISYHYSNQELLISLGLTLDMNEINRRIE
ncbi:MAG: hypothetical protein LPK80_04850 [Bacteroidota bacterium]|nr:hypothetical protein [Bacteroidota bacterium]MDX5428662.1 hypothetical protein [Bacteroidota bacterium]MDX5447939.1 hypothetical protein [Bacteroidota bacterium]